VPTTLLAEQHGRTFDERLADYPVRVETLSRFRSKAEQERIIESLKTGATDIVIGTHRLLQKDIAFRDLGLVIIDEEQRFGVEHKERLKRLRTAVDILTLTATPIPRTLHMALLRLRDISTLRTPPADRQAIHTRVCRYEPGLIRRAILRELARGGQVYYVHNRVESIELEAGRLAKLVPEVRLAVAHGQMSESELTGVMARFLDREVDVLVTTSIIESGIDIPTVNTLLVNRADRFGLADLHQLRGRVGRYKQRAYAYFMIPPEQPITRAAKARLKAVEDFSELGAGFRLALRDLEIRGAGNLLGAEQSGHIAEVGYDLYCRLLESSVHELEGKQEPLPEIEVTLRLGEPAYLPAAYVPSSGEKIEFYRKLANATARKDIRELADELADRCGPLPSPARRLLREAELRLAARAARIPYVSREGERLLFRLRDWDFKRLEAGLTGPEAREALGGFDLDVRLIDSETFTTALPPLARESTRELDRFLETLLTRLAGRE